jgi:hypothetical protein
MGRFGLLPVTKDACGCFCVTHHKAYAYLSIMTCLLLLRPYNKYVIAAEAALSILVLVADVLHVTRCGLYQTVTLQHMQRQSYSDGPIALVFASASSRQER